MSDLAGYTDEELEAIADSTSSVSEMSDEELEGIALFGSYEAMQQAGPKYDIIKEPSGQEVRVLRWPTGTATPAPEDTLLTKLGRATGLTTPAYPTKARIKHAVTGSPQYAGQKREGMPPVLQTALGLTGVVPLFETVYGGFAELAKDPEKSKEARLGTLWEGIQKGSVKAMRGVMAAVPREFKWSDLEKVDLGEDHGFAIYDASVRRGDSKALAVTKEVFAQALAGVGAGVAEGIPKKLSQSLEKAVGKANAAWLESAATREARRRMLALEAEGQTIITPPAAEIAAREAAGSAHAESMASVQVQREAAASARQAALEREADAERLLNLNRPPEAIPGPSRVISEIGDPRVAAEQEAARLARQRRLAASEEQALEAERVMTAQQSAAEAQAARAIGEPQSIESETRLQRAQRVLGVEATQPSTKTTLAARTAAEIESEVRELRRQTEGLFGPFDGRELKDLEAALKAAKTGTIDMRNPGAIMEVMADKAASRAAKKASQAGFARKGAPLVGDILDDLIGVGKWAYSKATDFATWSAQVLAKTGSWAEPYLKQAWDAVTAFSFKEMHPFGKAMSAATNAAVSPFRDRYQKFGLREYGAALEDTVYRHAAAKDAAKVLSARWADEVLEGLGKAEQEDLVRILYDERGRRIIARAQGELQSEAGDKQFAQWILENFNDDLLLKPGERERLLQNQKIADAYRRHGEVARTPIEDMRRKMGTTIEHAEEGESFISLVPALDPESPGGRFVRRAGARRGRGGLKPSEFSGRATGSADAYVLDYRESLARQLGSDLRRHEHNNLLRIVEGQAQSGGWAMEIVEGQAVPSMLTVNGKPVPAAIATFGPRRFVVPENVSRALDDLTAIEEMGAGKRFLKKVGGAVTGITLAAPVETTSHGWRVFKQLSRIPAFNESAARNAVEAVPFLRDLSVGQRVFSVDLGEASSKAMLEELARHGAIPARAFAEQFGWLEKIPGIGRGAKWYRDLVFGETGLDIRARVMAGKAYRTLHPDSGGAELASFVNQFGLYTRGLQSDAVRFLRDTQMNPFAAFQLSAVPAEIRSLAGSAGMGGDVAARAMALSRALPASLVTFAILNKTTSGHWPWENQVGHEFDLDIGIRKNGRPVFVPGTTMEPGFRALRMTGAKNALREIRKGDGFVEVAASSGKQIGDSLIRTATGGPPVDLFRRLFSGMVPPPIFGAPKVGVSQADQLKENMKAAFSHINPIIEASIEKNGYNQTREMIEKAVPGIPGVVVGSIAESVFPALAVAGTREKRPTTGRFEIPKRRPKEVNIPYVAGLDRMEREAMEDVFQRAMQMPPAERTKFLSDEARRFPKEKRLLVYRNLKQKAKNVR